MISTAGAAIGGAIALKVIPACSSESSAGADGNVPGPAPGNPETKPNTFDAGTEGGADANGPDASCLPGPQPKDYPYEQHLPAAYQLDPADVREKAYHYYYAGGCCHGSYRGLLEHLANTAGQPFNLLPLDFGKFGAGGIAQYGSICGAALGAVMIINHIVANADARSAMMTTLLRWYEQAALPAYLPKTIDAAEKDLTKDFGAANIVHLQTFPTSHLCHASVSGWCAAMQVSAGGADKKARCARLTADVAGKAAEMLNEYLQKKAFTVLPMDANSKVCTNCHTPAITTYPVASGMLCASCHAENSVGHP